MLYSTVLIMLIDALLKMFYLFSGPTKTYLLSSLVYHYNRDAAENSR